MKNASWDIATTYGQFFCECQFLLNNLHSETLGTDVAIALAAQEMSGQELIFLHGRGCTNLFEETLADEQADLRLLLNGLRKIEAEARDDSADESRWDGEVDGEELTLLLTSATTTATDADLEDALRTEPTLLTSMPARLVPIELNASAIIGSWHTNDYQEHLWSGPGNAILLFRLEEPQTHLNVTLHGSLAEGLEPGSLSVQLLGGDNSETTAITPSQVRCRLWGDRPITDFSVMVSVEGYVEAQGDTRKLSFALFSVSVDAPRSHDVTVVARDSDAQRGQAVVVDCGLVFESGHHESHLRAVLCEVKRSHRDVSVVTNERILRSTVDGVPISAILSATGYEGLGDEGAGDGQTLQDSVVAARALAVDFLSIDRKLSGADRILFLNVTPVILSAVSIWIQARGRITAQVDLYMLTGFGIKAVQARGRPKLVEDSHEALLMSRLAINGLKKKLPGMRVFVTSKARAVEAAALGIERASEYSIVTASKGYWRQAYSASSGYVCLYMGDAKAGKGVRHLPEVTEMMLDQHPDMDVVIHVNRVGDEFQGLQEELRVNAAREERLTLIEGHLSDYAFQKILERASLVVLLHEVTSYANLDSGVWEDSILAATPVVCRRDTLFGQRTVDMCGPSYVFRETQDLPVVIDSCLKHLDRARDDFRRANKAYTRWLRGASIV